jgi:hypothetical protein
MDQSMDQQIACIIMSGIIFPWYITLGKVAVGAVITVVSLAARYWRFFAQWLNGIRGRDWASVSAVVDIVSVRLKRSRAATTENESLAT